MASRSSFADRVRNVGGPNGITPPLTPTTGRSPSATPRTNTRHGSSEQEPRDVFGRAAEFYRSEEVPRTPRRARSPAEDNSRAEERSERRQSRPRSEAPMDHPIGLGFRIAAIEQTLKEHLNEISAQKIAIEAMRKDCKSMDSKVDSGFHDLQNRIAGMDKNHTMGREGLRGEVMSVIQSFSTRVDRMENDYAQLMQRMSTTFATPPGTPTPGAPPAAPSPPIPPTWNGQTAPDPWAQAKAQAAEEPSPKFQWGSTPQESTSFQWGSTSAPTPNSFGATPPAPNPGNQQPSGWTAGFGTNYGPWNEKDWTVGEKVSRELKAFDGQITHYSNWRNRIRDHFITSNVHYGEVFDLIEKNKTPITMAMLATTHVPTLPNVNWRWIASNI